MFSESTYCYLTLAFKMGYLLVYLEEQIIASTKAGHSKKDVGQLLNQFSKKLTNMAV